VLRVLDFVVLLSTYSCLGFHQIFSSFSYFLFWILCLLSNIEKGAVLPQNPKSLV
jgi:hypothetical protein